MDKNMNLLRENLLSALDAYIEGAFEEYYKQAEEQKHERQHAAFGAWHDEIVHRRQMES